VRRLLSRCPGLNRMYGFRPGTKNTCRKVGPYVSRINPQEAKIKKGNHQKNRFLEQADLQRGSILFGFFQ